MSRLRQLVERLCPDGVVYERFDSVCTLKARIGWQRLTKAERLSSGDYLLITGTDFCENHTIDYSTCEYVTKERYEQDENIQLRNGDVLLTKDGTLGKVVIVEGLPKPATLNSHLFVVRSKTPKLSQRFIMHYLLSYGFVSAMEANSAGSTIKGFTQKAFSSIRIPVPPLEVQREVVRILDSFQELDDALTAEIEAREKQYAAARDDLMLGGERYKARPFRDFCSSMNTGPFGSSVHKSDYVESGCPIVNPTDIVGTSINAGKRVSEEAESRLLRYKLSKGDIVIGRRGEMGRIGIVDEMSEGFLCGTGCFFVRMNELALPEYWRHFFGTPYAKRYLDSRAVGGTMKNLNLSILGGMPVPVPEIDVQISVVERLDAMTELVDALKSERDARRRQFAHYRDRLLSFPEREA